ncbi:E3 ubiquitin-protein ligase RNF13 isoform X2 [Dama dama]|uniref:E3 ubiquitin-protein ligase RNF13 isoform X2 n=1 Tax=Dama dama TaxID=30532 RepID=UPI002A371EA5|nr:E3 ubiquitin-protein ligase RNF13 isoform X2 [Dama dama]
MLLSIGMLMLSATQVYTILTVQLFAFLNLLPVEADILAYNFENASQTFDDLPARFGYRLPAEGLKGFLINSKPENACEPIVPPPGRDNSSGAFIVLIRRLDCNFDEKVLNAQRAGYKAAIVHNVDSDDLISMGSNDIEVLKKIDIPSVFIGESSANSLKDEFTYEKGGHIILVPEFSLPLEYYLIPFLIIVGICLILIVIFMITKFVQDRHRARRNRLRKDQLKKLPVHKFKKVFPNIRVFSNESALRIRWPKYWSFSFNIRPSNEHPRLISFRMDWLDLLAVQGTLKSLLQQKASPVQKHQFFDAQLSL